jgi:hypothetical protein
MVGAGVLAGQCIALGTINRGADQRFQYGNGIIHCEHSCLVQDNAEEAAKFSRAEMAVDAKKGENPERALDPSSIDDADLRRR